MQAEPSWSPGSWRRPSAVRAAAGRREREKPRAGQERGPRAGTPGGSGRTMAGLARAAGSRGAGERTWVMGTSRGARAAGLTGARRLLNGLASALRSSLRGPRGEIIRQSGPRSRIY